MALEWATTSHSTGASRIDDLSLFRIALPSIAAKLEKGFVYRVYIIHDADDLFFQAHANAIRSRIQELSKPDLSIFVYSINNTQHKPGPAMNFAMRTAYNAGADYLYRINDDTQFMTPFTSSAIASLQAYDPPLLGVVGPLCKQGNTAILTHDFVHRMHLDIFDTYYPPALTDWWLDDWMTNVYGQHRTKVGAFEVVHHMGMHGTRYAVTNSKQALLGDEVRRGKKAIARFLGRLVIAYSLYGADNPRYADGARANCKLAPIIYPGWQVWIYHGNKVSAHLLGQLKACPSVKLIDMSHENDIPPMAWRFLPAASPYIKAFIARDIDSRLSMREKRAVDEWLASDKTFHVMRDHPSHSNYPISGGMWGARGGSIKGIRELMRGKVGSGYLDDMAFLQQSIWPLAQSSIMQHDSFSCDKWGWGKALPVRTQGRRACGQRVNWRERQAGGRRPAASSRATDALHASPGLACRVRNRVWCGRGMETC